MVRFLAWLMMLTFAAPTVLAQARGTPNKVSPDFIAGVLTQMNLKYAMVQEAHRFTLYDQTVFIQRPDGGARIVVVASFVDTLGAAAIKDYNDRLAALAQATAKDGKILLHAELDMRAGVTGTKLRKLLVGFGHDLREFLPLVQPTPAGGIAPREDGPKRAVSSKMPAAQVPLDFLTPDQKAFEVKFPTGDADWETKWKIEWDVESIGAARKAGMGFPTNRSDDTVVLFKIKRAFFKPGKKAPWVQVLEDAHPSELYVPYFFRDTRFFDLRDAGNFVELNASDGGPRGRTLGKERHVMAELRDRGVAYKNGQHSRRAEELALWANFNAGNYTYLLEFGFMDDGAIAFRHAPTGYNLPSQHTISHMHNCCWRIGMHLALEGQKAVNTVAVAKWPGDTPHVADPAAEGPSFGVEPIKSEAFRDFEPKEFTKIRVANPNVILNAPGEPVAQPISYDLVPLVSGIARHNLRADENFTRHDFWITRPDSPVKQYIQLGDYFAKSAPRPLSGNGVVLWHMSSALHVPRSEDGILKGSSIENGQALATWTTVELRPRHLFASTPIYRAPR